MLDDVYDGRSALRLELDAAGGFAESLIGHLLRSETTLVEALARERDLLSIPVGASSPEIRDASEDTPEAETIVQDILAALSRCTRVEKWRPAQVPFDEDDGYVSGAVFIHPDIVYTLELWARVEATKPSAKRELVLEVQQAVLEVRTTSLGDTSIATLQAALELANTLREDPQTLELAKSRYEHITSMGEASDLDGRHPLVLSARQVLHLAHLSGGIEDEADKLVAILEAQRLRLGSLHPETLQSRLITFAVVSFSDREQAAKIADEILAALRDNALRSQRFFEAVLLGEKLALVYDKLGDVEAALLLLEGLVGELRAKKNLTAEDEAATGKLLRRIDSEAEYIRRQSLK
ncbi:hypothetical protein NKR23_g10924 [Pleurostoma richardsiae]|uniref:Tetratricopeptide repeat protein n=1 Tax=Pleurostoma richardsiae TaxID=41990 RepID=A0AA38R218_9PEZI|nr:hypothetical protein NKR23_g10924 [Pleurostoma richardsiae]